MANQSAGARVQEQLTQAVGSNLLPASVQEKAEHLLTRLQKPVRIAVMGLPGAGKSALLNLLVGANVLPEGARLPTLQLTHGDTAQAVCTLPDGSKQTLVTVDGHEIAALSPVFVDLQMPLPALAKISVLEVVAPEDPTAMHRASQWAAKRTDVALWCTQAFNTTEQALWAQMPDNLKDHAFLMITKADFLNANNMMDATMSAIRDVATDEFSQILPIATTDAIAARQADGSVDKALMRSSGALALISAVLKQVDMGRQSAVDMADVLLHQHADVLATAPTAESPQQDSAEPAQAVEATVAQTETPEAQAKEPTPEHTASLSEDDENVVTLQPATRAAYEDAVAYIVKNSYALIDLADDMNDNAPAQIIAKAVEHVQWLSDYLNENGDDADPALQSARDTAMDAADLVQLMQMEKRDSATIEALSLLLQLKHELQADLAA